MDPQVLILIVAFVLLMALNVPIAVALGLTTLAAVFSLGGLPAPYIVAQRMTTGVASFPLLAIPFFILAGHLMGEGGLARRLMDLAAALVGRLRGGMAYVNTITCMLFGAISGSATAAVSSIGTAMIPEMERQGYSRPHAIALTVTGATTGLLIPPSNIMIVYAVVAGNVSVSALFLAGILPGVLIGLLLLGTSFLMARNIHLSGESALAEGPPPFWRSLWGALPSLLLVFIVLAGILGGIFSATEASAVAVVYALFLGVVIYREIPLKNLPKIFLNASVTTAVVMFLIASSQAMSWLLTYEQVPQQISEGLIALTENKLLLLLLINLLLLAVGAVMDMTPAVLIFTPIFLPVAIALDIDAVHFGIILIANLCLGLCTPPVGTCLFVGCGIGKSTIIDVIPRLLPFFFAMLAGLAVITYWPKLSLWLPSLFQD
jgi:tripartite ATP-independent transporter DctM subunit